MQAERIGMALPRERLWAEFVGLYAVLPVGIAVLLPARVMFPALFAVTLLGLWLLWRTPGFGWGQLVRGMRGLPWGLIAGFGAGVAAVSYAVVMAHSPGALFSLARRDPMLLAMIWALYPVLSALPQELVFRPLFFRRYGVLLPSRDLALVLNAAVFALAHLIYWNWIVAAMTFAGGLVFAWAYEVRRSFPLAVILHSVAGWAIFTAGLGIFFYTGNVQRPF